MLKVSWKHRTVGAFLSFFVLVSFLHLELASCIVRVAEDDALERCLRPEHR